ncbi:MAG: sulfotransferase [Pseudomonadota bacterium]
MIGGMKCGTTALWQYLRAHPHVFVPPSRKNLGFFDPRDNWHQGLDWYQEWFQGADQETQSVGEISTEYSKYPVSEGVAENIAKTLPDAKLIYVVRHPIDRLVSQFVHMINAGSERRDINVALADFSNNPYVDTSRYGYQLSHYREHFARESLLVIDAKELLRAPQVALDKISHFLGVPVWSPDAPVVAHTRDEKRNWNALGRYIRRDPSRLNAYVYRMGKLPKPIASLVERTLSKPIAPPVLSDERGRELRAVFREDVALLREITGAEFDWQLDDG